MTQIPATAAHLRQAALEVLSIEDRFGRPDPLARASVYATLAVSAAQEEAAAQAVLLNQRAQDQVDRALENDHSTREITRLAEFIREHVPGEPSRSEGVVDTAIRLLQGLPTRNQIAEALDRYDDLVTESGSTWDSYKAADYILDWVREGSRG